MSLQELRRHLFEQHAVKRGLSLTRAREAYMFANGRRIAAGGYIIGETAEAWEAFNAALNSIEIVFPPQGDERYQEYFAEVEGGSFNYARYLRELRESIEAFGLKVKS